MNEHEKINLQMQQLSQSLGNSLFGLGGLGASSVYQSYNVGYQSGLGNALAAAQRQSPEQMAQEEARHDCALAMSLDWQTKRFMETVLPLDWCHRLYPEAYEHPSR